MIGVIKIIDQTLRERDSGKYSAKRATKFAVIIVMLILTCYVTIKNPAFLNWDILAIWLGYAGYNAYEMRKDKQISSKEIKKDDPSTPIQ